MTTICAVKRGNEYAIAADSLVCDHVIRHDRTSKITKVGDAFVGFSGNSLHAGLAYRYFQKMLPDETKDITKVQDVQRLFFNVQAGIEQTTGIDLEIKDNGQDRTTAAALFVNDKGICVILDWQEVHNYSNFMAIGSGSSFALGAAKALYEHSGLSASAIAVQAVHIATKYDPYSGGKITSLLHDFDGHLKQIKQ